MAESDFVIAVEKSVKVTEPQAMELWQLAITRGDANSPARIDMLLRALDEDGAWSDSIEVKRVEIVDTPQAPAATMLRQMILDAVVADSAAAQAYGIAGLPVRIAGRAVLAAVAGIAPAEAA